MNTMGVANSSGVNPPALEESSSRLVLRVQRVRYWLLTLHAAGFLLRLGASLLSLLFAAFVIDALLPMPGLVRLVLLLAVLGVLLGLAVAGAFRLLKMSAAGELNAAQRIDRTAQVTDQPVTRYQAGMVLPADDELSNLLAARTAQRADLAARVVKVPSALPLRGLLLSLSLFVVSLVCWLVLAAAFPSQFGAVLGRLVLPLGDRPPFSLTQFVPTWEPAPPSIGDDVAVSVQPEGRSIDTVDMVLLDGQGDEAERFTMTASADGVFNHRLRAIDQPITFRLEANQRYTRPYTITPMPRPPAEEEGPKEFGAADDPGGTVTFDEQAVARRDLLAHPDWPGLEARLAELIEQLSEAQRRALAIDPADLEAVQQLDGDLRALSEQADALSGELVALQGELPEGAAASLAALIDTLGQMRSESLAAAPSQGQGEGFASGKGDADTPSQATDLTQQWLDEAGAAAGADSQALATGLGRSSIPTESGTTSGSQSNANAVPNFSDPSASGTADEFGIGGDRGPLPPAVMQTVPASYRTHIKAYLNHLAEDTKPTPVTP